MRSMHVLSTTSQRTVRPFIWFQVYYQNNNMENIVTIIERFLEHSDDKLEELSQMNQELLETVYGKEEER